MLTENFIQFGALGIVAYVVVFFTQKMEKVINNNTQALTRFYEVASKCHKSRQKK